MRQPYGPWATLIAVGRGPELSAFWRRRMGRLAAVTRSKGALSGWSLVGLALAGALVAAVPTLRASSSAADEATTKAARVEQKTDKPDFSFGTVTVSDSVKGEQKVDRPQPKPWKLPNGTIIFESHGYSGLPPTADLNKCLAEKNYKFLKTFEDGNGQTQYVYHLNFARGESTGMNFSMPLDKVASWEDYQKKVEEQRQRRREKINQAVAAGRFRLLDLSVMQLHLCRDAASGQKFKIQRIPLSGGKETAFPRADYSRIPPGVAGTSWEEHLKAIREGKRELLALETAKSYTYETIADDGTKLIFNYGGGEPLKKPEGKVKEADNK